MDILDDMRVSKLSAKVFSKVKYSFNVIISCSEIRYFFFWHNGKFKNDKKKKNRKIFWPYFCVQIFFIPIYSFI